MAIINYQYILATYINLKYLPTAVYLLYGYNPRNLLQGDYILPACAKSWRIITTLHPFWRRVSKFSSMENTGYG